MSGAQLRVGSDGLARCAWCGDDPLYTDYHDREWGTPLHDERSMFELLCLEGAQAGLSWITVLRKRDSYRLAFDGFDAQRMATYGPEKVAELLQNPGIVRNRAKVGAFIKNAQALCAMHDRGESLEQLVWSFVEPEPRRVHRGDEVRATSPSSIALSKVLQRRGFGFVGPTIIYAYLQSTGVVDDHVSGCLRSTDR